MAKSAEELIKMRVEAFEEMQRLQMRIALIDGQLMYDPQYREGINTLTETNPELLAKMQPMAMLERNNSAQFN